MSKCLLFDEFSLEWDLSILQTMMHSAKQEKNNRVIETLRKEIKNTRNKLYRIRNRMKAT